MKQILVVASLLSILFSAHGNVVAESKFSSLHETASADTAIQNPVSIQVADGDWGNVNPKEIKILLDAIAADMLTHFPGRRLAPIEVFPTKNRPVVLYQKGSANQYQVFLAAKDRNWGEYIYEFSHELFHILANYEFHAPLDKAHHRWFEEMMCETASLYNLKKFSLAWKVSPPDSELASYVPALNKFTQRALNDPHRHLPENTSFAQWFRENEKSFFGNAYLRTKNEMVAMRFLPLLEQNPDWSAVGSLNSPVYSPAMTFYDYLVAWHKNTPAANRDFVALAMKLFEFPVPAADQYASITPQHQPGTTPFSDTASVTDSSARELGAAGFSRH